MHDGGNTARASHAPVPAGGAPLPEVGGRSSLRTHVMRWLPLYVAYACSRLLVLLVGFGAEAWMRLTDVDPGRWRPFLQAETYPHYADVAASGYTLDNASSFPLLPALLAGAGELGIPFAVTGMVVSHAAFLLGLVAMVRIGERYVGRDASMRAGIYLAVAPFSYWFSVTSTESLLLALLAGAVLLSLRGTTAGWLLAGACAAGAALCRPPGAFVGLALAGIALAQLRSGRMRRPALVGALAAGCAIPAAVLGFFAYLGRTTGDPLAALHAQADFNRELAVDGPVRAFSSAAEKVLAGSIGQGVELVATIGAAALLVLFATRAAGDRWEVRGWTALGAASLLLPVASGVLWQMPRFVLLVPPVLWMLGVLGGRPVLHRTIVVLGAAGLAVKTAMSVVGVEG